MTYPSLFSDRVCSNHIAGLKNINFKRQVPAIFYPRKVGSALQHCGFGMCEVSLESRLFGVEGSFRGSLVPSPPLPSQKGSVLLVLN